MGDNSWKGQNNFNLFIYLMGDHEKVKINVRPWPLLETDQMCW
jgi:hypothetical protein